MLFLLPNPQASLLRHCQSRICFGKAIPYLQNGCAGSPVEFAIASYLIMTGWRGFSIHPYSVFKLLTGFINAAFTLKNDTVAKATSNTRKKGITNKKGLISILKA